MDPSTIVAATAAGRAADAARDLAHGLGGPAHTGAASLAAARLAEHLDQLADALARIGLAPLSSIADDYVDDLLGPHSTATHPPEDPPGPGLHYRP